MIARADECIPLDTKLAYSALSLGYLLLIIFPGLYHPAYLTWIGSLVFAIVCLFSLRMWGLAIAATLPRKQHPAIPNPFPRVSLIIPSFNEESALQRTIPTVLELNYPTDKIEFFYPYESACSDATEQVIAEFARRDARVKPLRHDGVPAGKAAITNFALRHATGDIIAIFDADHCLPPDLVLQAIRHFDNPAVACVRGRCRIGNRHQNLLTSVVALERDVVERLGIPGADRLHGFTHFGGGHGFFNKQVLLALGGFNEEVLTEDIDLSVRLHLAGYEIRAVPELESWEESPTHIRPWIHQRKRWCRGWMQIWRAFALQLLTGSEMPALKRMDTLISLTSALGPVVTAGIFPLGLLTVLGMQTSVFSPASACGLWVFATATPMLLASGCLLLDWKSGTRPRLNDLMTLPVLIPYILCMFILGWICFLDEFIMNRPFAYVKTGRGSTDGARPAGLPSGIVNPTAMEKSNLVS